MPRPRKPLSAKDRARGTMMRARAAKQRKLRKHPWLAFPVVLDREFPMVDCTEVSYRVWRLDAPYTVEGHREGLPAVTVPEGFHFDGASVPRIFWIIDSPMGKALRAAVIHDWRYWTHDPNDRLFADDEFFWNCITSKRMGYGRAQTMYLGLRIGGMFSWNKGTREIESVGRERIKPLSKTKRRMM